MIKICPVCLSPDQLKLDAYRKFHLTKCINCKLVYSDRIPTTAELVAHYQKYNRNSSISPLTIKKYHQLLGEFRAYYSHGKILDVGCGSGFFLKEANQLGWDATGTEFGENSVTHCRNLNLNVYEGSIESLAFETGHFDVVTSFEVIEHLSDPLTHMQELYRILRPGGLLYMTTPNFNSISRYLIKDKWSVLSYPEHLSYFNAHSLDFALRNSGFIKKSLRADGVSIDRLRSAFSKEKKVSEKQGKSKPTKKPWLTNEAIREASDNKKTVKYLRQFLDTGLNVTRLGDFLKGSYLKPN